VPRFKAWRDYMDSNKGWIALKFSSFAVAYLFVVHLSACMWYLVGDVAADAQTWVRYYDVASKPCAEKYMHSLHWAFIHFAFAPNDSFILPQCPREELVAVGISFLGLLYIIIFASSTTNAMVMLAAHNQERNREEYHLRKFLAFHKVSPHLANRVWTFLHQSARAQGCMPEAKTLLLQELPSSYLVQIHVELYAPTITRHVLFRYLAAANMSSINRICHTAMSFVNVLPRHVLFYKGTKAKRMLFVASGKVFYDISERKIQQGGSQTDLLRPSNSSDKLSAFDHEDEAENRNILTDGDWISEMCLWMHWVHKGTLESCQHSQVFAMSAHGLQVCSASVPGMQRYGHTFCREISRMQQHNLPIYDHFRDETQLQSMAATGFPAQARQEARTVMNSGGGILARIQKAGLDATVALTGTIGRPKSYEDLGTRLPPAQQPSNASYEH